MDGQIGVWECATGYDEVRRELVQGWTCKGRVGFWYEMKPKPVGAG